MADLATLKSQLDAVTAAKMDAFNQINSTTFDAQAAYDAMQMFNPEGKKFSDSWSGSYNGQTFSDPNALYAAVQQDFAAKDAKAKEVRQTFNAKLAEEKDLQAQIDALPPEPSVESKSNAQADTEKKEGADSEKPTSDTATTNESPTNDNAGQKDYSGNSSDVPQENHGPSRDDEGNLMPGYAYSDELGDYWVGGTYVDSATKESASASRVSAATIAPKAAAAQAQWKEAMDLRAILRVPPTYLTNLTDPAGVLGQFGGIVFPYTPSISFDQTATYNAINPLHSNFTQYTYKNSAVGAIAVNAKFTVQNENDGIVLLGVIHLLRALTKMRFGPDPDAGAPPPVCRFDAYGAFMLKNIPVTVASFRHELPEGVDYISVGRRNTVFGPNLLPTISTINLTLNPTYSRSEQMAAGVGNWLSGAYRGKGYL